jgi:hypothetical protein
MEYRCAPPYEFDRFGKRQLRYCPGRANDRWIGREHSVGAGPHLQFTRSGRIGQHRRADTGGAGAACRRTPAAGLENLRAHDGHFFGAECGFQCALKPGGSVRGGLTGGAVTVSGTEQLIRLHGDGPNTGLAKGRRDNAGGEGRTGGNDRLANPRRFGPRLRGLDNRTLDLLPYRLYPRDELRGRRSGGPRHQVAMPVGDTRGHRARSLDPAVGRKPDHLFEPVLDSGQRRDGDGTRPRLTADHVGREGERLRVGDRLPVEGEDNHKRKNPPGFGRRVLRFALVGFSQPSIRRHRSREPARCGFRG